MVKEVLETNDKLEITDKFCDTMYELIRSDDFERVFGILSKKVGRDKDYFIGILNKIKEGEELEKEEKDLFLELLNSELFREKAEEIMKRLYKTNTTSFTIEQSREFIEKYPTKKVIEYLELVVNGELIELAHLKDTARIIKSKDILGIKYLELELEGENGEKKYCWKKEQYLSSITKEDFKFDYVLDLEKIDDKYYYIAEKNGKQGYIELGKEDEVDEKLKFDYVGDIKEINGTIYYRAEKNGKQGYIELGKEDEVDEKLTFDYVLDIEKIGDKYYYQAVKDDKTGYIELGKEDERKKQIKYNLGNIGDLEEDKKGVYFEYKKFFGFKKIYVSRK